jgi:hypothetical protein
MVGQSLTRRLRWQTTLACRRLSATSMATSPTPVADGQGTPSRAVMPAPPPPSPFRFPRSSLYTTARYAAHRGCGWSLLSYAAGERSSPRRAACRRAVRSDPVCRVSPPAGQTRHVYQERLRILSVQRYHLFNPSSYFKTLTF